MWLQHVPCVSIVLSGPFIHLQLLYVFAWSCAALIIWYTASPLFIWCIYFSVQLQDWFSLFLLQHRHFKCFHLEHVLKSTMCEKVWLGPSPWKTLVRQLLLALGMTMSVPQLASQSNTSVQPEVSQQFSDEIWSRCPSDIHVPQRKSKYCKTDIAISLSCTLCSEQISRF